MTAFHVRRCSGSKLRSDIVMEWAPYGNLWDFFVENHYFGTPAKNPKSHSIDQRDHKFPGDRQRILIVARQFTDGLSYVHSHGIVHRDIKPDVSTCSSSSNDFGSFRKNRIYWSPAPRLLK